MSDLNSTQIDGFHNEMQDLITVYIPTHNRSDLLMRAIESVRNQTYKNIEIIICDDGSSDDTQHVLLDLASKDGRIKYLTNEKPKGACYSRNRCIEIAQGEYITGLDDDDLFLPERLERFIELHKKTGANLLCSDMIFRNEINDKKWNGRSGTITLNMMGYKNYVGNQIFTKTSFMKQVGGFDVSFPAWQDYDLWYRLIHKFGPCLKIDEATYIVNIESGRQRITTSSKAHQGYKKFIQTHSKTLSKKHIKSLYIQDIKNRGDVITLQDILNNFSFINLLFYIKGKLK